MYRLRCWIREHFGRWELRVTYTSAYSDVRDCELTMPTLTRRKAEGFAEVFGMQLHPPETEVRRRT